MYNQNPSMMVEEKKEDVQKLHELLDKFYTYLKRNKKFHDMMYLNLLDKNMYFRGFSRVHNEEYKKDTTKLQDFKKLVKDNLNYEMKADWDEYDVIHNYKVKSPTEFLNSFTMWHDLEEELSCAGTKLFKCMAEYNVELYRCVIAMTEDVQKEMFRASQYSQRLNAGGKELHDLQIVDMLVHKAMEEHPGDLDITL